MTDIQQKTFKGPVKLVSVHSSGKSMAVNDGKNVFLDYGIPGEEVMYISHRRKQGFRSGEVTQIISPSQYRLLPFCVHHDVCGGCQWQHIEYDHQLRLKNEILHSALFKYGIEVPAIPDVIPSPVLYFYRHRLEYAFASGLPGALGFHNSNNPALIADIQECFMQTRLSLDICDFIKNYSQAKNLDFYDRRSNKGFLRSLSIRINRIGEALIVIGIQDDHPEARENLIMSLKGAFNRLVSINFTIHLSPSHSQLQGEIIPAGKTEPFIYEYLDDYNFRIHASSFFQPNVSQAENIYRTVREWAELKGTETVYDLYTGVGTIVHYLARHAKHITGIEGSTKAIEDARANAIMNNLLNTDFVQGDILETFTPGFIRKNGKPDMIVLDPPRSGTLIEIKKAINTSGAKKVIYLSCNPVSLAFDLKQLTEVYRVTRIQPFDMLPHTHHLETLVMLEKQN